MLGLIIILIAEYIGDFLLQDRETALNKSKDLSYLISHMNSIAMVLIIVVGVLKFSGVITGLATPFVALYCLLHGIQDWFIWRGYKLHVIKKLGFTGMDLDHPPIKKELEEFKYYEDKAFYDTIGLDRLLHVIALVILYGVFFL